MVDGGNQPRVSNVFAMSEVRPCFVELSCMGGFAMVILCFNYTQYLVLVCIHLQWVLLKWLVVSELKAALFQDSCIAGGPLAK